MKNVLTLQAPAKFAFVCKNGTKVRSIPQLLVQITKMDAQEFSHFVHKTHNHFANWIEDIFELEDLPNALRTVHTKKEVIAVLEATLSHTRIGSSKTVSEKKTKSKPTLDEKTADLHKDIAHLHSHLDHITRYDTHTPDHTASSFDPIKQEIRDKLIDFGFGLVIGLVLGVLIGKSLGAF